MSLPVLLFDLRTRRTVELDRYGARAAFCAPRLAAIDPLDASADARILSSSLHANPGRKFGSSADIWFIQLPDRPQEAALDGFPTPSHCSEARFRAEHLRRRAR
jgi:hypothetical protein